MSDRPRSYVFSDDQSWFSLWNLDEATHTTIVSLLNIALVNANQLKVLPVLAEENIRAETLMANSVPYITNRYLTKLEEPSSCEVELVTATLRTVLSLQAVPPSVYETVQKVLNATIDMLCNYASQCFASWTETQQRGDADKFHQPSEWQQGDVTCQTFGMLPSYTQVAEQVAMFNGECLKYYAVYNS